MMIKRIVWIIMIYLAIVFSLQAYGKKVIDKDTYAVALTTIPPRFHLIHKVLLSWIEQAIQPVTIYIFIPIKYRRFRMKEDRSLLNNQRKNITMKNQLLSILFKQNSLEEFIWNNTIIIKEVDYDWGPATKFIGIVTLLNDIFEEHDIRMGERSYSNVLPSFWILCDDDVSYNKDISQLYVDTFKQFNHIDYYDYTSINTISNFASQILPQITFNSNVFQGYTLFANESRVLYQLDRDPLVIHNIPHIQGVDTYTIPTLSLIYQYQTKGLLYLRNLIEIMEQFHHVLCSESFYQDDYIVSFLLHLSNITIKSLRNPMTSLMVQNIDGLSKSYYQMHMNEEVFIREYLTQQCITMHANEIYNKIILNSANFIIH